MNFIPTFFVYTDNIFLVIYFDSRCYYNQISYMQNHTQFAIA